MTVVAKAHAVMVVSNNVPEGHFMTVPALPFVHRKYPLQSFVGMEACWLSSSFMSEDAMNFGN